ncbi:uncharacterized protein LOC143911527 [Arctopsyche grandis]|uniref:uncharacterized protein LOC143911527 n=1 Tax=Arctopsyche grandis TaxID=121162 RepID=UPI00406D900E
MEFSLDLLKKWHNSVEYPTDQVGLDVFRDIVRVYHQVKLSNGGPITAFEKEDDKCDTLILICEKLLVHMKNGLYFLDAQPICSFAMCSLINILPDTFHILFVQEIHDIFIEYMESNDDFSSTSIQSSDVINRESLLGKSYILSLINGIFQSDLILNEHYSENFKYKKLSEISIQKSLEIVIRSCMKYSRNAYPAFKNLALIIEKITEWKVEKRILGDLFPSIIYITLYNWESLLPGIKELNSKVLHNLLRLSDNLCETFIDYTSIMPWNKANYYILSEIAALNKEDQLNLSFYEFCILGLNYSLKNPAMVSAGKDLYKVLLVSFGSFEAWKCVFYEMFLKNLQNDDPAVQMRILKYWVGMTLKKFPILQKTLLRDLKDNSNENTLLSHLFIIKTGRKNGQILNNWNSKEEQNVFLKTLVSDGLFNKSTDVRSQAFEIVCCSSKNTQVPTAKEFKIVESFLRSNINDDCTPFRQSVLNSFKLLMIRTRNSYVHHIIHSSVEETSKTFETFQDFCARIYNFLIRNLSTNGNYQRKITSLKIFEIILNYYSIKSDLNSCRKSKVNEMGCKVTKFLIDSNKWPFENDVCASTLLNCLYDPTNDVRDLASNILVKYFISHPYLMQRKNEFFINALVLCNSKFFYEVESGVLLLKLLFSFPGNLTREDIPILEDQTGNCDIDILEYLSNKACEDLIHHSKDPFYSICNNQPLYGLLMAINAYLKYTTNEKDYTSVLRVINIVSDATLYFLNTLGISCSNKGNVYPPSFHEMDESIDFVIAASQHKIEEDQMKDFQITNAQQLVLNNIWLNLKACSELSSTIIEKCFEMLYTEDIESCVDVNMSILTRCRHKGAIEYAGVHLGRAVKHITSQGSSLHRELLASLLEEVITEATLPKAGGASITRKSAGLAILVHRFVTNDSQSPKPLFIIAVLNLANLLLSQIIDQNRGLGNKEKEDDVSYDSLSSSSVSIDDEASIRDTPQARAIHLLCRTVADCSLSQYIIQFASTLSTICFEYFYSENWAVRNAALQLYGALVPKLVGQKMKDDGEILAESTISIDELFSHVPNLGRLTMRIFDGCRNYEGAEQFFNFHSSLIPVLSLLASTAKRHGFERTRAMNSHIYILDDVELFNYLIDLLHSSLYAVRNSAAKAIELFYSMNYFYDHCCQMEFSMISKNAIHGYLLVLNNHMKYFNCMKSYMKNTKREEYIKELRMTMRVLVEQKGLSFVQNSLYLQILWETEENPSKVNSISLLSEISKFSEHVKVNGSKICICIGHCSWINTNIYYALLTCDASDLGELIIHCMNNFDFAILKETMLPALKKRLAKDVPKDVLVVEQIIVRCAHMPFDTDTGFSKMFFDIFYKLLENAPIQILILFDRLFKVHQLLLIQLCDIRKCSHLIPTTSVVLSKKFVAGGNCLFKSILELTNTIVKLLEVYHYDSEMKMMTVVALKHLAEVITFFWSSFYPNSDGVYQIKANVISCVFWLLQDEDADIRHACSEIIFYHENYKTYPSNQLNNIFSKTFLQRLFNCNKDLISKFLNSLIDKIPNNELKNSSIVPNPFDHQIKNIYLEPEIMKDMLLDLMK